MTKRTAIVVGTGAGGAEMARDLQGEFQVTILEAGGAFKPFERSIPRWAKLRKTGLFFDEKLIRLLIPNMVIDKTDDMILVSGEGLGGTTTLATGNALRYDGAIRELGVDLDEEFAELQSEIPITTDHQKRWTKSTRKMYQIFCDMGLDPVVTPKALYPEKCVNCGQCAIGCKYGAKWDTRVLVDEAVAKGARLETNCRVTGLQTHGGRVTAVRAKQKGKDVIFSADVVVLAAGGLGTPVILKNSGIDCEPTLFVDPVLCVAGHLPGIRQDRQILMPFISQQDGYILSPYIDYLSFFFDRRWRYPLDEVVSIMIKLADEEAGTVGPRGIDKTMTALDEMRMADAVRLSRQIVAEIGVPVEKQFLGILNAGHPGGMLPIRKETAETLHDPVLPGNLYVADATLLPKAMGNPPILTIMALARKIAKRIMAE